VPPPCGGRATCFYSFNLISRIFDGLDAGVRSQQMVAVSSSLANDIVIVGYVMYICASVLYVVNASQPWSTVITDETNASVRLQP
jgi:hypothetical protein